MKCFEQLEEHLLVSVSSLPNGIYDQVMTSTTLTSTDDQDIKIAGIPNNMATPSDIAIVTKEHQRMSSLYKKPVKSEVGRTINNKLKRERGFFRLKAFVAIP